MIKIHKKRKYLFLAICYLFALGLGGATAYGIFERFDILKLPQALSSSQLEPTTSSMSTKKKAVKTADSSSATSNQVNDKDNRSGTLSSAPVFSINESVNSNSQPTSDVQTERKQDTAHALHPIQNPPVVRNIQNTSTSQCSHCSCCGSARSINTYDTDYESQVNAVVKEYQDQGFEVEVVQN